MLLIKKNCLENNKKGHNFIGKETKMIILNVGEDVVK